MLIFIKLGGSVITDKSKPYTVRDEVLDRLCDEISRARKNIRIVIGHGGGSFPHISANKYQTQKGIINEKSWEGVTRVQNDASKLNRIVVDKLIEKGVNAISVQPSASCVAENDRIVEWENNIEKYLEKGLTAVPYGDVCLDRKKGCCIISTEEIFNFLSKTLKPGRIIMVGKVDGVLDKNGNVIERISSIEDVKKHLQSSDGIADVTGGMVHKVERSLDTGIQTIIINGLEPGRLYDSMTGNDVIGTIIKP
jgi:isopentenyl phosphate kinase